MSAQLSKEDIEAVFHRLRAIPANKASTLGKNSYFFVYVTCPSFSGFLQGFVSVFSIFFQLNNRGNDNF